MTDALDRVKTVEEIIRSVPISKPSKKVLISFMFDYIPTSTEYTNFISDITGTSDFSYDLSLDPFYIYSTSYLEKKIKEWFTKMESFTDSNPSDDDLYVPNGQQLQCVIDGFGTNQDKITQLLQSIFTSIFACKRSGGTDIWLSFCGQYISGDSDNVVAYSPADILFKHIESVEPDYVVVVNRDINYFIGQTYEGNSRYNTYWYFGDTTYANEYTRAVARTNATGLTSFITGSKNYIDTLDTVCDIAKCITIIPAILHTSMQVRSQFEPIPYDFNGDGLVTGADLDMQGSIGIDNIITNGVCTLPLPNRYSKFLIIPFGDIQIRSHIDDRTEELQNPLLEYINCGSAIAGFLSILGDKYGFRPAINKNLNQLDLYDDLTSDEIDILVNSFITPLRRTIRNGTVTLGGNRVFYRVPSDYIAGYNDNNDESYDFGRIHCIVLCNVLRRELDASFEGFIGGVRANVISAAPTIISNIMQSKPIDKYTYEIKNVDIDSIELIIIIRIMNGISNISSSIIVGNLS